jgi:hypothetical protein
MLTLRGKIINVYQQPKGEKDGKEYGGQDKIQIMGEVTLQNGETRIDMFNLTAHNVKEFEQFVNKDINVPVGVMATGKSLIYFIPKGSRPTLAA